jgi:hypothetical protein
VPGFKDDTGVLNLSVPEHMHRAFSHRHIMVVVHCDSRVYRVDSKSNDMNALGAGSILRATVLISRSSLVPLQTNLLPNPHLRLGRWAHPGPVHGLRWVSIANCHTHLVHGNDELGVLHSGEMLDSTRDSQRDI